MYIHLIIHTSNHTLGANSTKLYVLELNFFVQKFLIPRFYLSDIPHIIHVLYNYCFTVCSS